MHRPRGRLLLLGWGGGDWQLVQPLLDAGRMPHLAGLVQRGCSGKLSSLAPPHPACLWTSLVTGQPADVHGVPGWTVPLNDADAASAGGLGVRPAGSRDWRATPLWDWVEHLGGRAIAVGWPATHPATRFAATVVSEAHADPRGHGFDDWPLRDGAVSPSGLGEALRESRLHPSEVDAAQVLPFIPQAARIDQETDPRLARLLLALSRAATLHGAATTLAEHPDTAGWNLLAVHFDIIEALSDEFLAYQAPRMGQVSATDHALYREVVDGAYQFMDLLLGRYLALAGPGAHVLLVSEHGYRVGDQRPGPGTAAAPTPLAAAYRPLGVLVAAGPGVAQDELVFGAGLLDIAPTALHLLGLPVPAALGGRVLAGLFERSPAAAEPPGPDAPVPPAAPARVDLGPPPWPTVRAPAEVPGPDDERAHTLAFLADAVACGRLPPDVRDPLLAAEHASLTRLSHQAQSALQRGALGSARAWLTELLALAPDQVGPRLMLAQCELAMRDLPACRGTLDDLAAASCTSPQLHLLQAQWALAADQPAAAEPHLRQAEHAVALAEDPPALLERIGQLHLARHDAAAAEHCFRAALALDADHAHAHKGLGSALAAQQRPAEAVEHLMRAIGLLYAQADAHCLLGQCLAALGRYGPAQQALNNALALRPDFAAARRALQRVQQAVVRQALDAPRTAGARSRADA